jgi:hypothetical protein
MAGEWGAMGPWLLTRTARTAPQEVRFPRTHLLLLLPPSYCPLATAP